MKKKIVLDLDQTLLCTVPKKHIINELNRSNTTLQLQYIDSMFDHITYIRPHLFTFLDYVFSHFDVSIFTAAMEIYAENIVEKLFSNYHLDKVLTNQDYVDCLVDTGKYKAIEYIQKRIPGYTSENTVIIDDSPQVAYSNPHNILSIKPFEIIDHNGSLIPTCDQDKELLVMINMLNYE